MKSALANNHASHTPTPWAKDIVLLSQGPSPSCMAEESKTSCLSAKELGNIQKPLVLLLDFVEGSPAAHWSLGLQ